MTPSNHLLQELPSIDRLFQYPIIGHLLARYNRVYVTAVCRRVLADLRQAIREGSSIDRRDLEDNAILARVVQHVELNSRSAIRRVVNGTGTVLHTNFGRALLASPAIEALCRLPGST